MVRISDPIVTSAMPRGVDQMFLTIHENESIYIPIGAVHRLANPGTIPGEQIEVQVGSSLGEDDIMHLTDQNVRPQLAIRHSAAVGWRSRWSTRRSNTCSAMRFFKISTEPPAIIQPRVCRARGEPSGCHETKQALERGQSLLCPTSKRLLVTPHSFAFEIEMLYERRLAVIFRSSVASIKLRFSSRE